MHDRFAGNPRSPPWSSSPSPLPLESQVGGHPGVLTIEDGSLLIKPAVPTEVAFYQALSFDPVLAPLRPFVPRFYGTLRLEGRADAQAARTDIGGIAAPDGVPESERDDPPPHSLVLGNLAHPFARPNILDVKLGSLLYDPANADAAKRARMEHSARVTTSGATGMRLTGFQVYDLATNTPVVTPKAYGRALTPAELPSGLARFFPLAETRAGAGLPADVLLPLLEGVRTDVCAVRGALATTPVRMVGASLLIVYEADCARAREALRLRAELVARAASEGADALEAGEQALVVELDDEADDGESGSEESDESAELALPYAVKLIDFAHTRIVPGGDTDTGVLLGLDTLLRLLDGRIAQIREAMSG